MRDPVTDFVVRGRRVVTPEGVGPAAVHVRGEVITRVADYDDVPAGPPLVDAGDAVVMPGLVDTHVHVNEPGRTEWEGFGTATRAAAAGGTTTVLDMPLNSVPPTTTADALETKRAAAAGRCHVDVGFLAGIVPNNLAELVPLATAGVFGFKAFLSPSGVEEFPPVDPGRLELAMRVLAPYDPVVMVHAESPEPIERASAAAARGDRRSYGTWLASRPDEAEVEAVEAVAGLAGRLGVRTHVLHLSSAEALAPLRAAHGSGARVTAETCPHYLALTAEEVPDGATEFKCAPPIRSAANRELLWEALGDRTIAMIVSDHSPSVPELKRTGDFLTAWGGIASLELRLPVVWTEARERGHGLVELTEWLASAPARLVGLDGRKGALSPGHDADLVVWDPDERFAVDAGELRQRHPVTPYAGLVLSGVVRGTFLRGQQVYGVGLDGQHPRGRLLSTGSDVVTPAGHRSDAARRTSGRRSGQGDRGAR